MSRKVLFILFISGSQLGLLQTLPANALNIKSTQKSISAENLFSGEATYSYLQSLVDHLDGTKLSAQSLSAKLQYRLNTNWSIGSDFSVNQDLRNSEDAKNGFNDITLKVARRSTTIFEWLEGGPSFFAVIPASKYSTEYENLQTTVGTNYGFSLFKNRLVKNLSFKLSVGGYKNFHKYDTDLSGKIQNSYGISEGTSLSYSINRWTASAGFVFYHGWSYTNRTSQFVENSQEISFSIIPKWNLSLGHTNKSAWFNSTGQETHFNLIDENDSIIYLSTALGF